MWCCGVLWLVLGCYGVGGVVSECSIVSALWGVVEMWIQGGG